MRVREKEREIRQFIYLRLPEEIIVDRDNTCRRMYSLNAHANDIIILWLNFSFFFFNFEKATRDIF